jgi:hypothetical protein
MPRDDRPANRAGGLIAPAAIDRWPRGVSCEGGFRLLGTPLGFHGSLRPGLLFLSSTDDRVPRNDQRVITTPFTAAAVGAEERDLDALTLGFGRKIRLGRMDISLQPAGLDPGAAQLEIGFKDRHIVYCGGIRLTAPLLAPAAEVARCDLLLLDVEPAEPRPTSPRRSGKKLAEWLAAELDRRRRPAVVCGSRSAALDTAFALSRLGAPVRACRPLFEMLRRVEHLGLSVPDLCRLEQSWPEAGVTLHYASLWPRATKSRAYKGPVAYVGPGRAKPKWAKASFRLGEGEDRPGLISYVKQTGTSKVALGPRCDQATAAMLARAGVTVYRVDRPTQIPLPI